MLDMELTGALGRLGVPITVVAGEADRHTTVRQARQIVDSSPGARLVVVPDAGHMLPFEAPELLAQLIADAARGPKRAPTGRLSAAAAGGAARHTDQDTNQYADEEGRG
jgi:fermentation-respiration switch protein FrsA (DUF1100 family)